MFLVAFSNKNNYTNKWLVMANLKMGDYMSITELRYLLLLKQSNEGMSVKDLENSLGVTDVAVYKELKRLNAKSLIRKEKSKIFLSDVAIDKLDEYLTLLGFMKKHLEAHCGVDNSVAYNDSIAVVCALSDEARRGLSLFVKNMEGASA